MSSFNDLCPAGKPLFRGSNGPAARAIMELAVGPVRKVAEFIRDQSLDVVHGQREAACLFFKRAITMPGGQAPNAGAPAGTPYVATPGATLANRLDIVLKLPRIAGNAFTVFEHVLYEPESQINTPRTSRLLESVTSDPRTAILYAYGILPDPWWGNQTVAFHRTAQPNAAAFVAVLPGTSGVDANAALSMIASIATPHNLTVDQAKERMIRDCEVLLPDAARPTQLIDLPPFNTFKSHESLLVAADALVVSGVAQWGGASCP